MSNRSSHFAHRFQTLPSALAGVPSARRLLALAVVLPLLALTLLPTAGQAQTPYDYSDDARAPRNLSAQVVPRGVELRWLPPAEDAASVDGYEILRRRPNRDEPTLTTLVPDTGTTDTTYTDTTATEPGVRYTYRVKAIRSGVRSSDWSNIAMVMWSPSSLRPLVSNIGQSASATANINKQYAQGFRLGKHGQGYALSSVSIDLAKAPSRLTVSLWVGGPPGVVTGSDTVQRKVFDFHNPTSFKVGLNRFTAPAGAFAYQNVNYFIVLSAFDSSVRIKETTSDNEDAGGETGAILFNTAKVRPLGLTTSWREHTDADDKVIAERPTTRNSVLRLALEGSKRERGILASTFAQPSAGDQEIISIGDECCFEMRAESADRYLIRGLSIAADDTSGNGGFFGLPFEMRDASDNTLFVLSHTTAQGRPLVLPKSLSPPAGITEWAAPQGATVEGGCPTVIETETVTDEDGDETEVEIEVVRCKSYDLYMEVTEIDGDTGSTRGGVTLARIRGRDRENQSDPNIAHDAQYYDTPTAAGVTFGSIGTVALDIPTMAIDGVPLHAMVQNLGQDDNGYVRVGGTHSLVTDDPLLLSQPFTTGFGWNRFRFRGIGINIEGSDLNANECDENLDPRNEDFNPFFDTADPDCIPQVPDGPSSVSVALYASDEDGRPGAKLYDLVSPGEFGPGHHFFEAPPGAILSPNTNYAVVWSYLGGSWHRLQKTSSTEEDSGALAGFSIGVRFLVGPRLDSLQRTAGENALEIAVYGEPVSATTMVSNLGQSDDGYVTVGGLVPNILGDPIDNPNKVLAQAFSVGGGSDRYPLQGIGINIEGSENHLPAGPFAMEAAVHAFKNGVIGDKLFDLGNPGKFQQGLNFFAAPPGAFLYADTSYAVVWSYLFGNLGARLQQTSSDDEDSGALTDFKIGNSFRVGADLDNLSEDTAGNALEIVVYGRTGVDAPSLVAGGYQVGKNWLHIPDDVRVGDQFRLVFSTQERTDATSADIEYYNAFVQKVAAWEGNHRIIRGAAPDFKAVVCTAAVDARTNTEIEGGDALPIHWVDGGWENRPTLLANTYGDFFSNNWIETGWGAIATGNTTYFSENQPIWTGCDASGFAHPAAHMGTTSSARMVVLGQPANPAGRSRDNAPLGSLRSSASGLGETDFLGDEIRELHKIFAMSPVFTVVEFR